jgi:SagB-type dehydrogenase family enzyme
MRTWRWIVALILVVVPLGAGAAEPAAPGRVMLPAARTEGTVSVEQALKARRSVREFTRAPLTVEEVGQLCWAAQGVTDGKHRTAPSARGAYPLELYVIAGEVTGLAAGLYRYEPGAHALVLVAPGDQRLEFAAKGVGQSWTAQAPALFVLAGATRRVATLGERGPLFMWAEAGLAAQGFFLQATALGLGSTFVGGIRPVEARAALGLPSGEEVLAVFPVGRRP